MPLASNGWGASYAQDAGSLVAPFEHGRAGAVAEQHARVAIGPVRQAGQALGSHHEGAAHGVAPGGARGFRRARGHQGLGHGQAVDEARAGGVHVEGDGVLEAQAAAQQARHRRHHRVRRDGGEHHEVDLARFEAPLGEAARVPAQRLARRLLGQVGVRLAHGHVPALDAGARPDPLVVRVDERLQVVVLHLKRRNRLAESHQCTAHDVSPAFDQDAPAPSTANGLPRKSRQYFDNQTNCLL